MKYELAQNHSAASYKKEFKTNSLWFKKRSRIKAMG
jgi:hypothetical protein